jgi:hypothetical protein
VFVSTAFVSSATMPPALEWFAEHQPVSSSWRSQA